MPVLLSHFTCNQCASLLSGTVYRTACDCVFCEDCTWRHFEKSSSCPKCGSHLGEEDFTELIVGIGGEDLQRIALQGMMVGSAQDPMNPCFAEGCKSLMRSITVFKTSTHFLLRQMILSSNEAQKLADSSKENSDATRADLHNAKREAERVRSEATTRIAALEAKLRSRETELVDLRDMLDKQEKINAHYEMQIINGGRPHSASRPTTASSASFYFESGDSGGGQRQVRRSEKALSIRRRGASLTITSLFVATLSSKHQQQRQTMATPGNTVQSLQRFGGRGVKRPFAPSSSHGYQHAPAPQNHGTQPHASRRPFTAASSASHRPIRLELTPSAGFSVPGGRRARTPDQRHGDFGGKSPNSISLRRMATPNQTGW